MNLIRLCIASALFTAPIFLSAQTTEEWSTAITKALQRRQAFPALARDSFNATERQAYEVQKAVVTQLGAAGDPVVGHKAGLTSEAAQSRFGAFEPVAGTLLKSHLKNTATFVSLRRFKGMLVEMELGFELKLSIRSEPRDVEELKTYVRQIYPIVELPNVDFDPADAVTVMDIIASNVAAATVIKGRAKPLELIDVNAVEVTLTHDNTEVAYGRGTDAMGDQWEALLWLVRQRLREGYEVKRNDLLITGAMGEVRPAEAGRYVADFGKLGRVTFSLR